MNLIATRKKMLTVNGFMFANGFAGCFGAATGRTLYMIVGFSAAFAFSIISAALKCPRCGTPADKRKLKFLGEEWTVWGGFWIPRNCSNCGYQFEANTARPSSGLRQ